MSNDYITEEEQIALTGKRKRRRSRKNLPLPKKIWQFIHYDLRLSAFQVFSIVIIVVLATALFSKSDNYQRENSDKIAFSKREVRERLYQDFKYYTEEMTQKEFKAICDDELTGCTYKRDGDPKKHQFDCISGVIRVLRRCGSNEKLRTTGEMAKLYDELVRRGIVKRRFSVREVRWGDRILIQLKPNSPSHTGLVLGTTPTGYVIYADVNGLFMTYGNMHEHFTSGKIYAIYAPSFPVWSGEIDKK